MTISEPASTLPRAMNSTLSFNVFSTMAEIRHAFAAGAWPTEGLALRAGILSTNRAMSLSLLRRAEGRYMHAARVWLQIANYHDDGERLVAALHLAAKCAHIGGDAIFACKCRKRAAAADRRRHMDSPVPGAVVSR